MMKWHSTPALALLSMLLIGGAASPAWAQDFHTEPSCWEGPRIYHVGPPSAELARKIERTPDVTRDPRPDAVVSPNGAYNTWVEMPNPAVGNMADQVLYVSSEQGRVTRFYIEQALTNLSPRWINEKLVFLRVPWGRTVFTDIIIDVESGEMIFNEEARDGRTAFEQFQQACKNTCPCDLSGVDDVQPPRSSPGAGEVIGHLRIDQLLNRDIQAVDVAAPLPLTAYVDLQGEMQALIQIEDPDDVLTDGNEEWKSALVYDRRPGWYQIGLSGGGKRRVWVKSADVQTFTSMPDQLRMGLAYLNRHWDGRIWKSPDGAGGFTLSKFHDPGLARAEYAAEFTEVRETETGTWLKVTVHETDDCIRDASTQVESGWVPAWSQDGKLVGGYYARGC